jgi:hypothetical protein
MKTNLLLILLTVFYTMIASSQGIIVNHTCTKIAQIPETAVITARQDLHIAYGHTSHGSQLTEGMDGLVAFMNGLGYTYNLYEWNNGGTGGALDLHDYAMDGDVGYYPDWVNNTRDYLGEPDPLTGRGTGVNADVNVIIWSWCGQVDDKYAAGTLVSEYIDPMVQLEVDYFGVKFVYMTGHLDHWDDANNKAANQLIRDFCLSNDKILYDFADIESYDPDSNYYEFAHDDCSYYSASGAYLGNWAIEWQNSHTLDVDWYECGAAHTQPLNSNQKAYAAWWLWAALAGWNQQPNGILDAGNDPGAISLFPNPSGGKFTIEVPRNINPGAILEIYNINGKRVYSTSLPGQTELEIDLSGSSSGIYWIRLKDYEKFLTGKFQIR